MRARAIFVGEDGSMGFRKNKMYEFTLKIEGNYLLVCVEGFWSRSIPYATMKALLKNWDFVNC